MFPKINQEELKTHRLFSSIILLALTVTVGSKLWSGSNILTAIQQTFTSIRPMELALIIGLWYQAINSKKTDREKVGLTTLQLND